MKIGLLGTGNLAVTLGKAWAGAGHSIVVTGRNPEHARAAAQQIGAAAAPVDPPDLAKRADVVVVVITWAGLESALTLVGAPKGRLAGKTVIDCTNPVDYATGRMLPESGSAAEHVAHIAVGAHVVKALHLFAGATWPFTGRAGHASAPGPQASNAATQSQASSAPQSMAGGNVHGKVPRSPHEHDHPRPQQAVRRGDHRHAGTCRARNPHVRTRRRERTRTHRRHAP